MNKQIDKANLFRNAWSIVRHTAMDLDLTPECARQFFGAALRKAWAQARAEAAAPTAPKTAMLTFHTGKGRRDRAWLARVTGTDARFGFARQFLRGQEFWDNGNKVRFDIELVEGAAFEDNSYGYYVVRDGALGELADKAAFTALFA
ncbi:hypothetical protein [Methylorubrum thiocyanatum]|uniref:Uncharacterized protein n=1 Tax=Methylorubrum thiocyanatum TaxID=47958 RepID=A0AA40V9C0_9HYPH|nr:hypothetical protein [Methylorubrum thiocyanatum]MBA8910980.1 hypothetical protein [Methylorubrum thiocyanatum]GJE83386.1 hypothetical protein CJNNKLLH_4759 [Methylorubrum thiocyanatum]